MTTTELDDAWASLDHTLRGYFHRRLAGDVATVDDLVQEVYLRMRGGLASLRSAGSLGPWVMRIARGVLIDYLRRQRPSVPVEDLPTTAPADAHDGNACDDLTALGAFVRERIDALPAHEAVALRWVDVDGLSPATAAARLEIGLSALKARLRRGRQRLRLAIDHCCAMTLDGRGQPADCQPRGAACGACTTTP